MVNLEQWLPNILVYDPQINNVKDLQPQISWLNHTNIA